jgi:hypothetical protein
MQQETYKSSGWWLRFYLDSNNEKPIAALNTREELQEFIKKSRLDVLEYDKSRFLEVGNRFYLWDNAYEVTEIHVKLIDYLVSLGTNETSIDTIVTVKAL